jgi:hypothetical protein
MRKWSSTGLVRERGESLGHWNLRARSGRGARVLVSGSVPCDVALLRTTTQYRYCYTGTRIYQLQGRDMLQG